MEHNFTKEELDLLYYQLLSRKQYFEDEMDTVNEIRLRSERTERRRQLILAIETIQKGMTYLLDLKSETTK